MEKDEMMIEVLRQSRSYVRDITDAVPWLHALQYLAEWADEEIGEQVFRAREEGNG